MLSPISSLLSLGVKTFFLEWTKSENAFIKLYLLIRGEFIRVKIHQMKLKKRRKSCYFFFLIEQSCYYSFDTLANHLPFSAPNF
jgi:hypothetical protein